MFPGSIKLLKISCFKETILSAKQQRLITKMIGSYISHFEMLQILPCEMLREYYAAKFKNREYYAAKFLNNKTNPKHAWKTVNEILGRSQKQDAVNEIKLPEKIVTSTRELVNVFNDYFTHVGPKLAEKIEYTKTAVALETLFLNMNQLRDSLSNL